MAEANPATDARSQQLFSALAQWTGLDLVHRGPELLAWISERATAKGFGSPLEYIEHCARGTSEETGRLLDRITVHYSWFFRDPQQIDLLAEILKEHPRGGPPISVWVPGCAGGEDVYSIALIAANCERTVSILGTDLNPNVLRSAARGRYPADAFRGLPNELRVWLNPSAQGDVVEMAAEVRRGVSFAVHNLLHAPPQPPAGTTSDGWQIILCRNVLLHFTQEHARATLRRLSSALARGGKLLLGAGEFMMQPPDLESVERGGRWLYVRPPVAPQLLPAARSSPVLPAVQGPRTADLGAACGTLPSSVLREAVNRLEAGEAESVLTTLEPIVQRQPVNEEVLLLVGMAEHMRGQFSRAIPVLREALALAPDLWPAAFYLALCYEACGAQTEAQRAYEEVARLRTRGRRDSGPIVSMLNIDSLRAELIIFAEQHARALRGS